MRSILALLFTVIAVTFTAGYLSLSYRLQSKGSPDYSELVRTRAAFVERRIPISEIDLTKVFNPETKSALLNPSAHLPQSTRYPYEEISRVFRYAQSCSKEIAPPRHPDLEKAWRWHVFRCGDGRSDLPDSFFETKPWLHPSGSSYAFMAVQSGREPFQSKEWIASHLNRMHVMEWAALPDGVLSDSQKTLSKLNRAALAALFNREPLALSEDVVLLEKKSSTPTEASSDGVYRVYSVQTLQNFLKSTPIRLDAVRANQTCLMREGNGCWGYNLDRIYRKARLPALLLAGLALVLAGIAAWVLFWTIRRQRQQAEQTRFAFQTLTHELRTPVTDLVLSLEPLRSEFDRLSSSGQDALLRVLDDSQRLVRLTENSKRYLGVAKYRSLKPNVETIASVSQFLSEIASQVSEKVVIDPQSIDVSIEQDPYWLAICVRNLMANAVVHGKPPVIVKTELVDEVLRISVTDHGQCEFGSLSDLTAPFKKGRGSRGLGLGLSIVQDAVRILGGKLDFKREPTSFALMIPVLNKKSLKESVNS